jgi:hypothetical protein
MIAKKSDQLLRTDVHTLAETKRFSKTTSSARMTLDRPISSEWLALFEKAGDNTENWDAIIKTAQRFPASVYRAALEACNNRHTAGKRLLGSRENARDFLDNL